MRELIFYVHVPFCSSKCHFCSWVSPIPTTDLVKSRARFGEYAAAVRAEIGETRRQFGNADVGAKLLYFGGGTPSLLAPEDLVSIRSAILANFPASAGFVDTTLEMSPDTATPEKLRILREGGFDRLSFGVQSFNTERAKSLGRAHTPAMAIDAFNMARDAGFENINIDLMVGFPNESEQEYTDSVATALGLAPDHLSVYIYKKVDGTVLARQIDSGKRTPCPLPEAVRRYERAAQMMKDAGYDEYMFQLFGRDGKRCNIDYHYFNLDYDYVGFGQGAHSLLNGASYAHGQTLEEYLRKPAPNHVERIADAESKLETKVFEMLHTDGGIDFGRFEASTKMAFPDAVLRYPRLQKALASILETTGAEQTGQAVRFVERAAKVNWLALPPHWSRDYQPGRNKTIPIALAH